MLGRRQCSRKLRATCAGPRVSRSAHAVTTSSTRRPASCGCSPMSS